MAETLNDWVAKHCTALQAVLDSAEIAIVHGNTGDEWSCPECEVKVAASRRMLMSGHGMTLISAEKCAQIPPLDEKLP
ncbi:MAG TPA: hypothetical protein VFI61_03895 [Patescibacteria group bacterium]|nr:hypothetical protein [Patescibacteria group bacterium]